MSEEKSTPEKSDEPQAERARQGKGWAFLIIIGGYIGAVLIATIVASSSDSSPWLIIGVITVVAIFISALALRTKTKTEKPDP